MSDGVGLRLVDPQVQRRHVQVLDPFPSGRIGLVMQFDGVGASAEKGVAWLQGLHPVAGGQEGLERGVGLDLSVPVALQEDAVEPKIYDTVFSVNNGNMIMQTNIDLNNHKIINLANPTDDGDACNKRYVDIVDTKINDLSYYTKDHRYKNVFGEDFYDLIETSRFNLIQGVSGVVINRVVPNFVLETDRFITDYDPKYGLKLSTKSHIRTIDVNQSSSFTFFMSFMHDSTKTCEISFSNTLNLHVKWYPRYRITSNKLIMDYQLGTHETTFTSDFQNKQLFVWICFDGAQNLYKMALSNYSSHVAEKGVAWLQGLHPVAGGQEGLERGVGLDLSVPVALQEDAEPVAAVPQRPVFLLGGVVYFLQGAVRMEFGTPLTLLGETPRAPVPQTPVKLVDGAGGGVVPVHEVLAQKALFSALVPCADAVGLGGGRRGRRVDTKTMLLPR